MVCAVGVVKGEMPSTKREGYKEGVKMRLSDTITRDIAKARELTARGVTSSSKDLMRDITQIVVDRRANDESIIELIERGITMYPDLDSAKRDEASCGTAYIAPSGGNFLRAKEMGYRTIRIGKAAITGEDEYVDYTIESVKELLR